MELTYTSPIRFEFAPKIGSILIFEFKLRAKKNRIKINVDTNIYHKDPFVVGRISLSNSGIQSVYTSTEDVYHIMRFKIPEFQNPIQSYITQSYINISMEPAGNLYEKVIIEEMKVSGATIGVSGTTYSHPNIVMAVPNTGSKMGNSQEIKELVAKGYRDILKREPDPSGLENYINQLKNGLSVESFHDILRSSQEFKDRFKEQTITRQSVQKPIDKFLEGQKIAIASIVRDEEGSGNLGRFLECCGELEQYHKNLVYIFIEGDSSDRTYEVLKNWIEKRNGSILEKLNKGHSPFGKVKDPKRTMHLAELRNRLVDLILSAKDIGEVLMIDANYGWKGDLITSLRNNDAHITAPLAVSHKDNNGRYIFYDIWVFRKNGKEFWPLYPYAENMEFDRPTTVDSVGSGYLIKRQVLEAGVRYDGSNDSEQVGFCHNAQNQGFIIKINPNVYIRKGGLKE